MDLSSHLQLVIPIGKILTILSDEIFIDRVWSITLSLALSISKLRVVPKGNIIQSAVETFQIDALLR